jgi:hypothetical protein
LALLPLFLPEQGEKNIEARNGHYLYQFRQVVNMLQISLRIYSIMRKT